MSITPPENTVTGQIWSWIRIDCGPTIGWVRRPMFNDKYIITGVTYTVQPFDWRLLINRPATAIEILLPDVALWMRQSYGLFPIQVKDIGNASLTDISATPITVTPFAGQTIDGLVAATNPVQISSGGGSLTVEPKSDLSGWNLLP